MLLPGTRIPNWIKRTCSVSHRHYFVGIQMYDHKHFKVTQRRIAGWREFVKDNEGCYSERIKEESEQNESGEMK